MRRPSKAGQRRRQSRKAKGGDKSPEAAQRHGRAQIKNVDDDTGIPPVLPNTQDMLVVDALDREPIGTLAVDRFFQEVRQVRTVRQALRDIYIAAAQARASGKATQAQLKNAKQALGNLTQAHDKLAQISSDGRDGLRMVLEGPALDDAKGKRELNQFAGDCWAIRRGLTGLAADLHKLIEAENNKLGRKGQRQQRLRTLVAALAYWWESGKGSIAPTVDANRLHPGSRRPGDKAPRTVVHGRRGRFMAFAIVVFCKIDCFKQSEVEAAVTNVHEERLAARKAARQ